MRKSECGRRNKKGWEHQRWGDGERGMCGIRKAECGLRPVGAIGPTPRREGGIKKEREYRRGRWGDVESGGSLFALQATQDRRDWDWKNERPTSNVQHRILKGKI